MAQDDFAPTQALGEPRGETPRDGQRTALDIRFTGSGSEYFRIWIVNLLLTLVTLTLYWPFARARRMAYFQNNTLVGGDPLGFHADPWKMFRGYLVMLALGGFYWVVSHFAPTLAWLAFLVFMLLWPALWRASMQFRLRNTSWRGVRLWFGGDLASAYGALLPLFLPGLAFVLLLPPVDPDVELPPEVARRMFTVIGVVMVASIALLPWMWARLKRYQHGGYRFAQERTELRAGTGSFYGLFFKLIGLALMVMLVLGVLLSVVLGLSAALWPLLQDLGSGRGPGGNWVAVMLVLAGAVALFYVAMPLVLMPFATSRLQNLVWGGTRSRRVAFRSQLRFRSLLKVTVLNTVLLVLTLGLYWPFAKVRVARLRLEAMSLDVTGDVDEWVASAQAEGSGVLGDAAGDFFGMDLGL